MGLVLLKNIGYYLCIDSGIRVMQRKIFWKSIKNLEPQKLLRRPRSVAIDSDKMLYIADNESYRIQVYRKEVIPLTSSELAPPFRAPTLSQE